MDKLKGLIIKAIGGFYYVKTAEDTFECKARGALRRLGTPPLVGDYAEINLPQTGFPSIEKVVDRKNMLARPPIANLDIMIVVVSTADPAPNTLIIDKMLSAAVKAEIIPAVVITKCDIKDDEAIFKTYRNAGIEAICVSSAENKGIAEVMQLVDGKKAAFVGNSGVGKSTLLNTMFPGLELQTNAISTKLGRGKHTTRTVCMYENKDGYVIDTPGFSTMDLQMYEIASKDDLPDTFPEFEQYFGTCQFNDCSHTCEKGCSIIAAVKEGKIGRSRYESYLAMYNEVKDNKFWENK